MFQSQTVKESKKQFFALPAPIPDGDEIAEILSILENSDGCCDNVSCHPFESLQSCMGTCFEAVGNFFSACCQSCSHCILCVSVVDRNEGQPNSRAVGSGQVKSDIRNSQSNQNNPPPQQQKPQEQDNQQEQNNPQDDQVENYDLQQEPYQYEEDYKAPKEYSTDEFNNIFLNPFEPMSEQVNMNSFGVECKKKTDVVNNTTSKVSQATSSTPYCVGSRGIIR